MSAKRDKIRAFVHPSSRILSQARCTTLLLCQKVLLAFDADHRFLPFDLVAFLIAIRGRCFVQQIDC